MEVSKQGNRYTNNVHITCIPVSTVYILRGYSLVAFLLHCRNDLLIG